MKAYENKNINHRYYNIYLPTCIRRRCNEKHNIKRW